MSAAFESVSRLCFEQCVYSFYLQGTERGQDRSRPIAKSELLSKRAKSDGISSRFENDIRLEESDFKGRVKFSRKFVGCSSEN